MVKKKTKKKVKKVKIKAKPKAVRKRGVKRKVALILSIVAIAILLANVIYNFAARETLLDGMRQTLSELPAETIGEADVEAVSEMLPTALTTFTIIWLVLLLLTIWTTTLLEREKSKWYILLILGIVTFLTLRIFAGILLIISSILYLAFFIGNKMKK